MIANDMTRTFIFAPWKPAGPPVGWARQAGRGRADSYMCVSERACDYVRGSGESKGYSKLTFHICQLEGFAVVFNGLEYYHELLSRRLVGGWKRQGN